MWLALGLEAGLCEWVGAITKNLLKDENMIIRIKSIYKEMINFYTDIVNKRISDKFGRVND